MTTCASIRDENHSRCRHSSRNLSWKLSMKPFFHGCPGGIKAGPIFLSVSQVCTVSAVNSLPLSERRKIGARRCCKIPARNAITSSERIEVATRIPRHSRVNSSKMLKTASCGGVSWTSASTAESIFSKTLRRIRSASPTTASV